MTKLRKLAVLWKLFCRDTKGVSAIEYVVIGSGVAVFVVLAWTLAGTQISAVYTSAANAISGTTTTATDSSDSAGATETASASNDDDSDSDTDSMMGMG